MGEPMRSEFIDELSLAELPRQKVSARTTLNLTGLPTDRMVWLQQGLARGSDGVAYEGGQVLNLREFLALSHYQSEVRTQAPCILIHIPRGLFRDSLCEENPLTWTLARSIAVECLSQNRVA